MKLSDFVADWLISRGVKHLFLLPGGGCMHLCDSIGKRSELDYVCCLHEQACAFAAEAYSEYEGQLGVCLVTSGPGGTNALTGAACAWIEGAPVLFISGQAKRADLIGERGVRSMGPQEVDIVSMARPVTKYSTRLIDPFKVREELERAVSIATTGRPGPVWIDIPLDVQAAQIDPTALGSFIPSLAPQFLNSSIRSSLEECLTRLATARRPVIYAGNGVRTSGKLALFRELVDKLGLPVLLTWKAADFLPEDHPCYIGRPGGMGQRAANFTQQKADWLLVLGARLDLPSIAFDPLNFAPNAYKTVVDIDSAELRKISATDNPVHADLDTVLPEMERISGSLRFPDFSGWRGTCRDLVRRYPVVQPEYWHQIGAVSTYVLVEVLSKFAEESDVIVPGSSGPCSDILMQGWKVKRGQRIFNAPGLGAMGTGLPGTIGACLASGGRRVINVNGDGGFQLNIQELETVRRLGLPIKYFILDNGGYRSIVAMQRNHFEGRLVASDPSSRLTLPNTARVAEAFGIPSFCVTSADELADYVRKILSIPGPVVCVVKTSPDEVTAPKCMSEVRPDGTVVTKPMEDMWPYLDRAEYAGVMAE